MDNAAPVTRDTGDMHPMKIHIPASESTNKNAGLMSNDQSQLEKFYLVTNQVAGVMRAREEFSAFFAAFELRTGAGTWFFCFATGARLNTGLGTWFTIIRMTHVLTRVNTTIKFPLTLASTKNTIIK